MGIPRGTARLLLEEHHRRPFSGSVLQFGRSSIYFTFSDLQDWARRHRVELADIAGEVRLSHDPRLARQGCIDDHTFFRALGFETVESCDISDWEEAEHVFDLNHPIPDELEGRFDTVLDPGSSLHTWLCGIAKNKIRTQRRKRRPRLIEDVLEEIVGEIDDETDPEEEDDIKPDTDIDGKPCFAVRALTRIEDFNEYFGCELTEEEDYDTIGGLVMHELGRLPRLGEKLDYGGFEFCVTRADRRRIDALQVVRLAQENVASAG